VFSLVITRAGFYAEAVLKRKPLAGELRCHVPAPHLREYTIPNRGFGGPFLAGQAAALLENVAADFGKWGCFFSVIVQ